MKMDSEKSTASAFGLALEEDDEEQGVSNPTAVSENSCVICEVRSPGGILVPCGHAALCTVCHREATNVSEKPRCPVCMREIDTKGEGKDENVRVCVQQGHGMVDPKDPVIMRAYGLATVRPNVVQDTDRRKSEHDTANPELFIDDADEEGYEALLSRMLPTEKAGDTADDHVYAYEGLGDDFMTNGPWVPPSIDKAKEFQAQRMFAGGKAAYFSVTEKQIADVDVGTSIYFRLLRYLLAISVIMLLSSAPAAAIYGQGERLPARLPDTFGWTHYSLGNMGPFDSDYIDGAYKAVGNNSKVPMLHAELPYLPYGTVAGITVNGSMAAAIIIWADFGACCLVLFLSVAFRWRLWKEIDKGRMARLSAADYSVLIKGVPHTATAHDVGSHFSKLFALDGTGVMADGSLSQDLLKEEKPATSPTPEEEEKLEMADAIVPPVLEGDVPVKADQQRITALNARLKRGIVSVGDKHVRMRERLDEMATGVVTSTLHNDDPWYKGTWVADVSLVTTDGPLLASWLSAAEAIGQLRELRARSKMYGPRTPLPSGFDTSKMMNARKKAARLELDLLHRKVKTVAAMAAKPECSGTGFVTFNQEESLQRCLLAYQGSDYVCLRSCQRRQLQYKQTFKRGHLLHPLNVSVAPAPTDLLHENLGYSDGHRAVRRFLTAVVTVAILAAGLGGIVAIGSYTAVLLQSVPDFTLCDTAIPVLYLGNYDAVQSARVALGNGVGPVTSLNDTYMQAVPLPATYSLNFTANALPSLSFFRPTSTNEKYVFDSACPTGLVAMSYRYDFRGIPFANRGDFPNLPVDQEGGIVFQTKRSDPTSEYYTGNMVNYGNPVTACISSSIQMDNLQQPTAADAEGPQQGYCPDPRRTNQTSRGQCACVGGSGSCKSFECFSEDGDAADGCTTFTAASIPGCYCLQRLEEYLAAYDSITALSKFSNQELDACSDFLKLYIAARTTVLLAGSTSSIINAAIAWALPLLVVWERHISIASHSNALVMKIAAAQTLNAAFSMLLVNARPPNNLSPPAVLKSIGVFNGQYSDFSSEWYATVGSTICLTMSVQVVIPFLFQIVQVLFFKMTQSRLLKGKGEPAVNQEHLNAAFVGPVFPLALRYPLLITNLFLSLIYGSGMPVLYAILTLHLLLTWAFDRWLFLRYNAKPLDTPAGLAIMVLDAIPWGLALHLAFGVWAYTGSLLLPSSPLTNFPGHQMLLTSLKTIDPTDLIGIQTRLARAETYPLLVLLGVMIGTALALRIGTILISLSISFLSMVTCGFVCCRKRGIDATKELRRRSTKANAKVMPEHSAALIARGIARFASSPQAEGMIAEALALQKAFKLRRSRVNGKNTGRGKALSPFAGEFSQFVEPPPKETVSEVLRLQGWRMEPIDFEAGGDALRETALLDWKASEALHLSVPDVLTFGQAKARRASITAQVTAVAAKWKRRLSLDLGNKNGDITADPNGAAALAGATGGRRGSVRGEQASEETPMMLADKYRDFKPVDEQHPERKLLWVLRKFPITKADVEVNAQPKQTWEVLADNGIASYDFRKSEKYADAVWAVIHGVGGDAKSKADLLHRARQLNFGLGAVSGMSFFSNQ